MEQIINNACKYVDVHGKVEIYGDEDDESIILTIRDNGMGIPDKDIGRIFDRGLQEVDEIIKNSNHRVEMRETANFLYVSDSKVVVVKLSTFKKILSDLNVEGREKIISELRKSNDEVGYVERPEVIMSLLEKEDITVGDKKYQVKVSTKVPLFGNGVPYPCVVVSDGSGLSYLIQDIFFHHR